MAIESPSIWVFSSSTNEPVLESFLQIRITYSGIDRWFKEGDDLPAEGEDIHHDEHTYLCRQQDKVLSIQLPKGCYLAVFDGEQTSSPKPLARVQLSDFLHLFRQWEQSGSIEPSGMLECEWDESTSTARSFCTICDKLEHEHPNDNMVILRALERQGM